MTCEHECLCDMTGQRGITVLGDGEPGNPYVVSPSVSRTIPRTATAAAGLPSNSDDEIGQLGYATDEQLYYVWTGATYGWKPVGPKWMRRNIGDSANFGDPATTVVSSTGLALGEGFWHVILKGYVDFFLSPDIGQDAYIELWNSTLGSAQDEDYVTGFNPFAGSIHELRSFTCSDVVNVPASTTYDMRARFTASLHPNASAIAHSVKMTAVRGHYLDLTA